MIQKNIVLLYGGGGPEHEISKLSANLIREHLIAGQKFSAFSLEMDSSGKFKGKDGTVFEFRFGNFLTSNKGDRIPFEGVIPCIHGPPGEDGQIQAFFETLRIPYFGPGPEASALCFNKISCKIWLEQFNIPTTPFCILEGLEDSSLNKAQEFLKLHKEVFIKSSSQGSSIGCFRFNYEEGVKNSFHEKIKEAFSFSPYVLIEKSVKGRELEVATYEYKGEVKATSPGEIVTPQGEFYTFHEKYDHQGKTETLVKAKVSDQIISKLKDYSLRAFKGLKLRYLSRVDFFLDEEQNIYLNEINSFPGMTPNSLFPKMIEANGDNYSDYLHEAINQIINPI